MHMYTSYHIRTWEGESVFYMQTSFIFLCSLLFVVLVLNDLNKNAFYCAWALLKMVMYSTSVVTMILFGLLITICISICYTNIIVKLVAIVRL